MEGGRREGGEGRAHHGLGQEDQQIYALHDKLRCCGLVSGNIIQEYNS